jgi:hypothetical protein
MKRFRLSTLMLLIVIATLVAALVVERRRAQQIAIARATAKLDQLWDDPTFSNLRSQTTKSLDSAKSNAVKDER